MALAGELSWKTEDFQGNLSLDWFPGREGSCLTGTVAYRAWFQLRAHPLAQAGLHFLKALQGLREVLREQAVLQEAWAHLWLTDWSHFRTVEREAGDWVCRGRPCKERNPQPSLFIEFC